MASDPDWTEDRPTTGGWYWFSEWIYKRLRLVKLPDDGISEHPISGEKPRWWPLAVDPAPECKMAPSDSTSVFGARWTLVRPSITGYYWWVPEKLGGDARPVKLYRGREGSWNWSYADQGGDKEPEEMNDLTHGGRQWWPTAITTHPVDKPPWPGEGDAQP